MSTRLGAAVVAVVLVLAPVVGADESAPSTPGDLVMQLLDALRAQDFTTAYALASKEMRRHFSRGEFEWMVKRAHPEVASSAYAFVVRTHESDGFLYVTVKVQGRNGQPVEAVYELVREKGQWKVNALSSRGDEGTL